jgi:hypothetical protein
VIALVASGWQPCDRLTSLLGQFLDVQRGGCDADPIEASK